MRRHQQCGSMLSSCGKLSGLPLQSVKEDTVTSPETLVCSSDVQDLHCKHSKNDKAKRQPEAVSRSSCNVKWERSLSSSPQWTLCNLHVHSRKLCSALCAHPVTEQCCRAAAADEAQKGVQGEGEVCGAATGSTKPLCHCCRGSEMQRAAHTTGTSDTHCDHCTQARDTST